jgi:hypothetical protein
MKNGWNEWDFKMLVDGKEKIIHARWHYWNEKVHREDGPAFENSLGVKVWYLEDKIY